MTIALPHARMRSRVLPLLALLTLAAPVAAVPPTIKIASAPGRPWKSVTARSLASLPEIPPDPPASRFGGSPASTTKPTGFFHTRKANGRWWLIDPDGHPFISRGIASIRQTPTSGAREALEKTFTDLNGWATATTSLLSQHGFTSLGPWSDDSVLRPAAPDMPYTRIWNFMSAYEKERRKTFPRPAKIDRSKIPPSVFDPQFSAFCDLHARQLEATRNDPALLGHFSDNELPWNHDLLKHYLALPATDPGHITAIKWLRKRHGSKATSADITTTDHKDFLVLTVETYFAAVSRSIRRHDPNHLYLGSRFHGRATKLPELFAAAGKYLDVVSVNYYHAWSPDPQLLASWSENSAKPILITEWYAKALDSGLANTNGAGWLVKTQADRAAFYQNFTFGLLESRVCVGWDWFRYADNDPADNRADPSNRDANKGIVSNRYVPYQTLLDSMRAINIRTYGIIRHLDRSTGH